MSSPPDSAGTSRSLGRAAFFGLAAGMLLGGAGLLVLGVRGLLSPPSCAGLSKNECDMLTEAVLHIGRVQTICGGALIALALSLYVLLRPYLGPRPAEPPKP
ncbi:MAG: hypothetical protein JXB05_12400 [Myxococcaceae bacterium]|nr:hypothetical protein [Myxococcaceae bacterium]